MEIDEKSVTKVIYVVSQCRNSGSKEDALEMQDTLLFKGEEENIPPVKWHRKDIYVWMGSEDYLC